MTTGKSFFNVNFLHKVSWSTSYLGTLYLAWSNEGQRAITDLFFHFSGLALKGSLTEGSSTVKIEKMILLFHMMKLVYIDITLDGLQKSKIIERITKWHKKWHTCLIKHIAWGSHKALYIVAYSFWQVITKKTLIKPYFFHFFHITVPIIDQNHNIWLTGKGIWAPNS